MLELTAEDIDRFRQAIARVDVIFLADENEEVHTVVFGKERVAEAAKAGVPVRNWLTLQYRRGTDDFKGLLDLLADVRGNHEWYGE